MKSLSELNAFSAVNLELTDLRNAKVVFDRTLSQDKVITISSTSVTVPNGIEIVEIVNYSTANVRYVVTIKNSTVNPISSSLTFASPPSGVTVVQSPSGTYTVSGIKKVSDWNAMKNPVWTLPNNYASFPLFYLEARVIYFDQEAGRDFNQTADIYDTRFYPITFAEVVSTITPTVIKKVSASATMVVSGGIISLDQNLVRTTANLSFAATIFLETFPIIGYSASISSQVAVSAAGRRVALGASSLAVNSTFSATMTQIVRLINQAAFTAEFGRVGPAGVPYLEGNGLPYYNTDGTLLNIGGVPPGIIRIKQLAASVTASSTVTCIGNDARLMSAMVMSSGTMTCSADRLPGLIDTLTANFSVNLPDGGNIEGGRASIVSSASVSCSPAKTSTFSSAITAVGSFAAGPFSIVPGINLNVNRNVNTVGLILSGTVNVEIIWGDGTTTTATTAGTYSRDYGSTSASTSSTTPIIIRGTLTGFNGLTSGSRILSCPSFGTIGLTNVSGMFAIDAYASQYPLGAIPSSIPSTITNVSNLFKNRTGTWPELLFNGAWNTANITNMEGMFNNARTFTGFRSANPSVDNIGYWETGNVTNMNDMFNNAVVMNTDISGWCVSNIPTKPTGFDTGTSAGWITAEKPIWGTCP